VMQMAKQRVTVSYGRTVQSAPYESIRLDVAIEKDIEVMDLGLGKTDDAFLLEAIDKSVNGLRRYIKSKIAEILDNE
jgi:hypothetical protein